MATSPELEMVGRAGPHETPFEAPRMQQVGRVEFGPAGGAPLFPALATTASSAAEIERLRGLLEKALYLIGIEDVKDFTGQDVEALREIREEVGSWPSRSS